MVYLLAVFHFLLVLRFDLSRWSTPLAQLSVVGLIDNPQGKPATAPRLSSTRFCEMLRERSNQQYQSGNSLTYFNCRGTEKISVTAKSGGKDYIKHDLGTVNLASGTQMIKVQADGVPQGDLMELRALHLNPMP